MTTPAPNPDAEREVDLAAWRRALVRMWWLPALGLVVGAIAGVGYSLRGHNQFKAAALVSLGQPTTPGGSLISSFGTNPLAVKQLTDSASAQSLAERKAGLPSGAIRGKVSVDQVGLSTGAGATHATPLIELTVRGISGPKTAIAANALAAYVVLHTTAPYVGTKIKTFHTILHNTKVQLGSINQRITAVDKAIGAGHIAPITQLVLVSQLDNDLVRQGNLLTQQASLQTQLSFADEIESAKVITEAKSVKSSAHSRSASVVVGGLIGLLLGAFAAIAGDGRARRA